MWNQGLYPHFCDTRFPPFIWWISLWEAHFVASQKVISHSPGPKRTLTGFVASTTNGGNHGIRAPSGHSDFGFARPAELCNILFLNMSDCLGGAFHVTKPSALEGIMRGIVPGGNDHARRLAVHVGVFAPWDNENISTKTALSDVKEGDDLIAIYVPTRNLSVYQPGVGRNCCCFRSLPLREIRAIWSFKSVRRGPVKEVKRIYSRIVENEISPSFKDAEGVTRLPWERQQLLG